MTMMKCWIYKSNRNPDHYLFSDRPDDLQHVPAALRSLLGPVELVMTLDLTATRRLARAESGAVLAALSAQGYYLQMPPHDVGQ